MKNQLGSARLDTVLKMLMITFISFLAFSFGVYFGKAITTSDHQLKSADSEFKSEAGKVASRTKDLDVKGEDVLVDEEVASLSDKYVSAEKENLEEVADEVAKSAHDETPKRAVASEKAESHGDKEDAHGEKANVDKAHAPAAKAAKAAPAAKIAPAVKAANGKDKEAQHEAAPEGKASEHEAAPAGHAAAKPSAHSAAEPVRAANHEEAPIRKSGVASAEMLDVQKAARRVASNEPPTEEPTQHVDKEARTPSALPKTVGAAKEIEWTVQVASYPTTEGAKAHVDELTKKGFPAYPVEAKIGGKVWYRVSVGSFKSQAEATNYLSGFKKQAGIASAIVQKIQR